MCVCVCVCVCIYRKKERQKERKIYATLFKIYIFKHFLLYITIISLLSVFQVLHLNVPLFPDKLC